MRSSRSGFPPPGWTLITSVGLTEASPAPPSVGCGPDRPVLRGH